MLPTPSVDHLSRADFEHVYEPAEDTFILLDALEQDAHELRSAALCVEIGSGSGMVSTFLARITRGPVLSTDINAHAAQCTLRTAKENGADIDCVQTDLAGGLDVRMAGKCDVLLFNPPYVPTDEDEWASAVDARGIAASWSGGRSGMNATERFLDAAVRLLSGHGVVYLVAIKQNEPLAILERMRRRGLDGAVALNRRAGGEHLYVLKLWRGVV